MPDTEESLDEKGAGEEKLRIEEDIERERISVEDSEGGEEGAEEGHRMKKGRYPGYASDRLRAIVRR